MQKEVCIKKNLQNPCALLGIHPNRMMVMLSNTDGCHGAGWDGEHRKYPPRDVGKRRLDLLYVTTINNIWRVALLE